MRGSVVARDIVKSFGGETILDRVSLDRAGRGPRSACSGRTGSASRRCSACSQASTAGHGGTIVRDGTVGYLPQEADAPPARRCAPIWRGARASPRRSGAMDALAARLATRAGARGGLHRRARALPRARRRRPRGAGGRRVRGGRPRRARSTGRSPALSGGQAARARLAALLLARFDLFCLDEPTNDLDFAGLDAARAVRLLGCAAAIVVVSHDRAFLERTVDRDRRARAGDAPRRASTRAASPSTSGCGRRRARPRRRRGRSYGEERDALLRRCSPTGARRRAPARERRRPARRRTRSRRRCAQAERRARAAGAARQAVDAWQLRLELAPGPAAATWWRALEGAVVARGDVPARAARPRAPRAVTAWRSSARTGRARRRCCGRCSASCRSPPGAAASAPAPGSAGSTRDAPCSTRASRCWSAFAVDRARAGDARTLLGRFGLRGGAVAAPRALALARRADARARRPAGGARRERARARRADQPPRSGGDRGAGGGARGLRRRRRARHARPAPARGLRSHPHARSGSVILIT